MSTSIICSHENSIFNCDRCNSNPFQNIDKICEQILKNIVNSNSLNKEVSTNKISLENVCINPECKKILDASNQIFCSHNCAGTIMQKNSAFDSGILCCFCLISVKAEKSFFCSPECEKQYECFNKENNLFMCFICGKNSVNNEGDYCENQQCKQKFEEKFQ